MPKTVPGQSLPKPGKRRKSNCGLKVLLVTVLSIVLLSLPATRIYLCGASITHLKSGEWVISGPWVRMTDARLPRLVNAINRHGKICCMRISNPGISDDAYVHFVRLKSLSWLFIEDSAIGDKALQHFAELRDLKKLYFDRCPNLSERKIDWLRNCLPDCEIRVDAYSH